MEIALARLTPLGGGNFKTPLPSEKLRGLRCAGGETARRPWVSTPSIGGSTLADLSPRLGVARRLHQSRSGPLVDRSDGADNFADGGRSPRHQPLGNANAAGQEETVKFLPEAQPTWGQAIRGIGPMALITPLNALSQMEIPSPAAWPPSWPPWR